MCAYVCVCFLSFSRKFLGTGTIKMKTQSFPLRDSVYLIDRLVLTALVEVLVMYWGTQRRQ